MPTKREHAYEMLLLIAALAIVQFPAAERKSAVDPPGAAPSTETSPELTAASRRLDPVGLLQGGVPEDWQVSLSPPEGSDGLSRAC